MTDPDLVLKKIARIETCVQDLRRLARLDALESDLREERFVQHTLQLAVQAAIDAAAHVVADERLGEPRTLRDLFDLLRRAGWIEEGLAASLRQMCGFRNALVHEYESVDLAVVREICERRLGDLLEFARVLRARLSGPSGG